jgi:DNA-binding response OmpR family regulator
MDKARILTVDDDANLQAVLCHYLEQEGYQYFSALNGQEMLQSLEIGKPDIILLDLTFPHENGLTLLSVIRSKSRAAVIVISGKTECVDRIISLEMGADDYLPKPFELRELSARIKAVLRRTLIQTETPANDCSETSFAKAKRISFNGWILDRLQYQLFDESGKTADLTSGEFKLLEALVTSPHRVLTREHLFDITRGSEFDAFDRAIDIQIGRIRKKMNDDPRSPVLLKTIRGVGYLFAGDAKVKD